MPINTLLKDELNHIWELLRWIPSEKQFQQLNHLQELLQEANKKTNLTKLSGGNDFWISQILDSLWPFQEAINNQSPKHNIIDVGTGCGLPGLALAIALPNTSITLVDSIHKKTSALKSIVRSLDLTNKINIRTERIELTGQNLTFRGKYNIAIARAVASAPVLVEYLIPLLSQGGEAVLYKGKWSKNDSAKLKQIVPLLNANIKKVAHFELPDNRGVRNAIYISKIGECPNKFPRSVGTPSKKPLII